MSNKVDRLQHMCLTSSTEKGEDSYFELLDFYTGFLGLRKYRIAVEQMDLDKGLEGMDSFGIGAQDLNDDESGHQEVFHYLAGEYGDKNAAMIDFILFTTKPGQNVESLPSMNGMGLRNITLLVDNIDEMYERGQAEGVNFLGAPAIQDWPGIGTVKYAVLRDPEDNPVELIQIGESTSGDKSRTLRVFSLNINTHDAERALAFYRDGCGMTVEHTIEHSGEAFGQMMGFDGAASATSYLLKGEDKSEVTAFFIITEWHTPATVAQNLTEGYTPAWYRMFFWVEGFDNVRAMHEKMKPQMKQETGAPMIFPTAEPWSDRVLMSFFYDHDDCMMEFACHEGGGVDLEPYLK